MKIQLILSVTNRYCSIYLLLLNSTWKWCFSCVAKDFLFSNLFEFSFVFLDINFVIFLESHFRLSRYFIGDQGVFWVPIFIHSKDCLLSCIIWCTPRYRNLESSCSMNYTIIQSIGNSVLKVYWTRGYTVYFVFKISRPPNSFHDTRGSHT